MALVKEKVQHCCGGAPAGKVAISAGLNGRAMKEIADSPSTTTKASSKGKLEKAAILKTLCAGFQETTEPTGCLTEDIQTNECLENNGGCWQDKAINITACKVGAIGNLVHSSPNIKKEVLNSGALQPVIGLLSSCCTESQREATLLLGQFASAESKCKVHIVQRGAVRPLIEMLQSADFQLREMAAFALGRLAQDTHNQAGIACNGGLLPLLKLLDSKNGSLQHNASSALYGVVENVVIHDYSNQNDYVSDFVKVGGVQKLQDGEFIVQATKDCVAKTLKRLEEKINERVLKHLVYLMRVGEKSVQRCVALALSHLCAPEDQRTIFVDNNGLDLLLDLLVSVSRKHQQDGSVELYKLANKAASLSLMDAAPPSARSQVSRNKVVCLQFC